VHVLTSPADDRYPFKAASPGSRSPDHCYGGRRWRQSRPRSPAPAPPQSPSPADRGTHRRCACLAAVPDLCCARNRRLPATHFDVPVCR
jgi:hypothetical protein